MWNKNLSQAPDRDQLGLLIGIILLGLAITQFVQLPSRQLGATVLGSALDINISGYWVIIGVLVILAGTGMDLLIRTHPRLADRRLRATFAAWILPGLTVLVAGRILLALTNWPLWWAGLMITGALLGAVISAEYALVGAQQLPGSRAWLFLNIIAYVFILILYAAIYQTRSRSLVTATAVAAASFLVALRLLWSARLNADTAAPNMPAWLTWLLAGVISLLLAECSWALNYWQAGLATASLVLLIIFYTTTGLAAQRLLNKLSRQVLIEFGLVALISTGLLIVFHP